MIGNNKGAVTILGARVKELVYTVEIKRVQSKKTQSLDLEYEVIMKTDDPSLLELGLIPADTLVKVEVTPLAEESGKAKLPELSE